MKKKILIKLSQDTLYFIYNFYIYLILLILITTSVQIILEYTLLPKKIELMFINNFHNTNLKEIFNQLSENQKNILMKLSITNNIIKILTKTFLYGNILTMLHLISNHYQYYQINIIYLTKLIIQSSLKLFLLILLITLFIQLGLFLFVIPGIIIIIFMSLAPIILIENNTSIIQSIYSSIKISMQYIYIITPIMLLWILIKTIIILWVRYPLHHIFFINFFLKSLTHAISTILLIYLYRFYTIKENIKIKI